MVFCIFKSNSFYSNYHKSYGSGAMFKLLTTFRAVYENKKFFQSSRSTVFISTSCLESNQTVGAGIEYRSFQRNGRERGCFQLSKADLLYERTLVWL